MISKEKKTAIIKEYARTEGDRFTGSSGCSPDSKNPGADRALKEQPEGSSFQTWSAADGRSETWSAGLSEEE